MATNKKYYFLKLKEDFFQSRQMVVMEQMQDGIIYSNLLLKMYLLSIKFNGYMMLSDKIPLSVEMIAKLTGHEVGTVERGIKLFMQLDMVDEVADGGFFMKDIPKMLGQSTTEADRKTLERCISVL